LKKKDRKGKRELKGKRRRTHRDLSFLIQGKRILSQSREEKGTRNKNDRSRQLLPAQTRKKIKGKKIDIGCMGNSVDPSRKKNTDSVSEKIEKDRNCSLENGVTNSIPARGGNL